MMIRFSLIYLLIHLIIVSSQSLPLLLVISFDGFRFDYSNIHGPLGNFSRLKQRGVHAHSMTSTFNTDSLPNDYTLITGLYEEIHGIVSEQIYDRKLNEIFQSNNMTDASWWTRKSIWIMNEQRMHARTGVIGWKQESLPISKYEKYREDQTSKEEIIDQMVNWLSDSNEGINFGTIFFAEPGLTGQQTGPFSDDTKLKVKECDDILGYLLDSIEKNIQLKNNLHLILISNHGLEQINATTKPIYLDDYIDMKSIQAFGTETLLNIFINSSSDINEIFAQLTKIPHTKIYRKENIPSQYHYKHHSNIGDLIILLEPGYELYRRSSYGRTQTNYRNIHGNSGYDNSLDSMKTIFYASGPQFKENYTLPKNASFNNVDLFGLICLILGMDKCTQSNSSLTNIQSFLLDPQRVLSLTEKETEKLHDGPMGLVIYLLVLVSFVLILIMAVVWTTVAFRNATAMARLAHPDPATIAEQNQYKFTQIHDSKLNRAIGDDNL